MAPNVLVMLNCWCSDANAQAFFKHTPVTLQTQYLMMKYQKYGEYSNSVQIQLLISTGEYETIRWQK
jgi:hypothetical protein